MLTRPDTQPIAHQQHASRRSLRPSPLGAFNTILRLLAVFVLLICSVTHPGI